MEFRRPAARPIVAAALFASLGVAGLGVAPSRAQEAQQTQPDSAAKPQSDSAKPQSDSTLKSVLKIVGFATDVNPPPDFVQQTRPAQPPSRIPVFIKSPEPPGNAKSIKDVDAMSSDLEAISKRDDKLRASFPPAAKAVAAAAAAKAAKSKNKVARKSPIPSF